MNRNDRDEQFFPIKYSSYVHSNSEGWQGHFLCARLPAGKGGGRAMADSPEEPGKPEVDRMEAIAEEIVRDAFSPEQQNECREILADLIEAERSGTEKIGKYQTWILFIAFFLFSTTLHSPNAAQVAVPSIFSELGLIPEFIGRDPSRPKSGMRWT